MVLGAGRDAGEVAHAQPLRNDEVGDIVGGMRLGRGDDEVLLVVLRHAPDRGDVRALPDRGREVLVRQALPGESRRVGDDLDLTHIAPLHVHASDAGHARDERLDLVARDVVQRRRIAALEIVGEHRKERRRQALDGDHDARREVALDLIHARLYLL